MIMSNRHLDNYAYKKPEIKRAVGLASQVNKWECSNMKLGWLVEQPRTACKIDVPLRVSRAIGQHSLIIFVPRILPSSVPPKAQKITKQDIQVYPIYCDFRSRVLNPTQKSVFVGSIRDEHVTRNQAQKNITKDE